MFVRVAGFSFRKVSQSWLVRSQEMKNEIGASCVIWCFVRHRSVNCSQARKLNLECSAVGMRLKSLPEIPVRLFGFCPELGSLYFFIRVSTLILWFMGQRDFSNLFSPVGSRADFPSLSTTYCPQAWEISVYVNLSYLYCPHRPCQNFCLRGQRLFPTDL